MSLTYGFYDSLNGDRKYNARQISSIFDGIVKDGVYANYANQFAVKETYVLGKDDEGKDKKVSNPTKSVLVDSGRAWFNRTWTYNDADMNIDLSSYIPASPEISKYLAIVIDVNEEVTARENSIIVLEGETGESGEAEKPVMINEEKHHQYPLAYIKVSGATEVISQSIIENVVGTETPLATGLFSGMTIDTYVAQWQKQLTELIDNDKEYFDNWFNATIAEYNSYSDTQKAIFDQLAADIKSTLSTNQYTYLVSLIDDIKPLSTDEIDKALENS